VPVARIELSEQEIVRLLGVAALARLRPQTPNHERERSVATARTALDALCGLEEREGSGAAFAVLRSLEPQDVRALALLMVLELNGVGWTPPPFLEG
jgi:hypothetical protein